LSPFLRAQERCPKKGTRRKSFTAYSVILGTFRKLADRLILVRYSFSFKEKDGMRMGFSGAAQHPALARGTRNRWAQDSPKCLTLGLGRMPGFSHGRALFQQGFSLPLKRHVIGVKHGLLKEPMLYLVPILTSGSVFALLYFSSMTENYKTRQEVIYG
jgi:hypothetical protein